MARPFSLAGLLRLRQLQQQEAAGRLATANQRQRENAARQAGARAALAGTLSEATDASTLYAVAAARASARSMLTDLTALASAHETEAAQAREAFSAARKRSHALEKLEARHNLAAAAEDVKSEQTALDEIASTAWQRRGQEGSR